MSRATIYRVIVGQGYALRALRDSVVLVGDVVWQTRAKKRLAIFPAQLIVGDSFDQQRNEVPDRAALEIYMRMMDHFGHPLWWHTGEGAHQSFPNSLD